MTTVRQCGRKNSQKTGSFQGALNIEHVKRYHKNTVKTM